VHQQARDRALLQAAAFQVPCHLRELDELFGGGLVDAGLADQDIRLQCGRRVIELQRHEALAGGLLEVLEHALVAGVVGDGHVELRTSLDDLAEFFHRQHAAVVGDWLIVGLLRDEIFFRLQGTDGHAASLYINPVWGLDGGMVPYRGF